MIISKKYKYIFIKTKKAGTTSLEKYLLELDPTALNTITRSVMSSAPLGPHTNVRALSKHTNINDYTIFSIIRNPWDKAVSKYYFDLYKGTKEVKPIPFSTWCTFPMGLPPDYTYFTITGNPIKEHLKVDKLIKYENINTELEPFINKELGIKSFSIDKYSTFQEFSNYKPKNKHYSKYYNEDSKKLITKYYNADIRLFDWKFEEKDE